MVVGQSGSVNGINLTPISGDDDHYDRAAELKAFDDTKAGVKGLVDAGISEIPRIFCRPPEEDDSANISDSGGAQIHIPVIDLEDVEKDPLKRKEVVERIGEASEELGFFQLINHGIQVSVMEEMKEVVRRFNEQDAEVKKQYYTRDVRKPLIYNSNFDLYTAATTSWRDTFGYIMAPNPPNSQDLPEICRDTLVEYSKEVMELGRLVFELLSEALGLNPHHLNNIGCSEGLALACHYYPQCPHPNLTLGTVHHTDGSFITVLLQDHVGGLQIRHRTSWLEVPPVPGALVVNIGDLMQLITNDRFKSVQHRVLANREARVSVSSFFVTLALPTGKLYGPIKELVSEENKAKYREVTVREFNVQFRADGLGTSTLQHFKL